MNICMHHIAYGFNDVKFENVYHFVSSFTFGLCNSYNSISMPESDIYIYMNIMVEARTIYFSFTFVRDHFSRYMLAIGGVVPQNLSNLAW